MDGCGFVVVGCMNKRAVFRHSQTDTDPPPCLPSLPLLSPYSYPKYMNAIMDVNQAAAVIVTSVGEARRLGIDEDRWVYLHGTGTAYEYPVQVIQCDTCGLLLGLQETEGSSGR